ncbi:MAG: carbohydrate binding family 9 domain-containing protein, partial [Gemmatimonadaceae bacterium]|nr:carbohydrate binding family 9 domain-containing protein [Gemmatimonadaceae bacterium]
MLLPALLLQLTAATTTVPATSTANRARDAVRNEVAAPAPIPTPMRLDRAPQIDGRDDDEVWRAIPVISDFRQFEPSENGDPTLRTEARIGYDANNLYVLVRSFDPRPDSVLAVLQRRDNFLLSDDVVVGIDSYNDKRTGYLFRLTPAGSMAEGYMFNDGEEDWGWNAVWQGAAKVDSLGWVAEYRIPLSQLRYVPSGDNTF